MNRLKRRLWIDPSSCATSSISSSGSVRISRQSSARRTSRLSRAHYNLGISFAGIERVEESIASYRRALEIKPGYARAQFSLGKLKQAIAAPWRSRRMLHASRNLEATLVGNVAWVAGTIRREPPPFFQSFLTGASKLLISFLHHRGSQLSGRDQLGAAQEYVVWRVPETFDPSGKQPCFDVQEFSQLPFSTNQQGCCVKRLHVSSIHRIMLVTSTACVCSASHITTSGAHGRAIPSRQVKSAIPVQRLSCGRTWKSSKKSCGKRRSACIAWERPAWPPQFSSTHFKR